MSILKRNHSIIESGDYEITFLMVKKSFEITIQTLKSDLTFINFSKDSTNADLT